MEGGTEAAVHQRRLSESDDADTLRRAPCARFFPIENPFRTAERFGIQDSFDPPRTRPLLCGWVRHARRLLPVTRRALTEAQRKEWNMTRNGT